MNERAFSKIESWVFILATFSYEALLMLLNGSVDSMLKLLSIFNLVFKVKESRLSFKCIRLLKGEITFVLSLEGDDKYSVLDDAKV